MTSKTYQSPPAHGFSTTRRPAPQPRFVSGTRRDGALGLAGFKPDSGMEVNKRFRAMQTAAAEAIHHDPGRHVTPWDVENRPGVNDFAAPCVLSARERD